MQLTYQILGYSAKLVDLNNSFLALSNLALRARGNFDKGYCQLLAKATFADPFLMDGPRHGSTNLLFGGTIKAACDVGREFI